MNWFHNSAADVQGKEDPVEYPRHLCTSDTLGGFVRDHKMVQFACNTQTSLPQSQNHTDIGHMGDMGHICHMCLGNMTSGLCGPLDENSNMNAQNSEE